VPGLVASIASAQLFTCMRQLEKQAARRSRVCCRGPEQRAGYEVYTLQPLESSAEVRLTRPGADGPAARAQLCESAVCPPRCRTLLLQAHQGFREGVKACMQCRPQQRGRPLSCLMKCCLTRRALFAADTCLRLCAPQNALAPIQASWCTMRIV
jgi:hypothetical protein